VRRKHSIIMGNKLFKSRLKCFIHPNYSYLRCSIFLKSGRGVLISERVKSPKTGGSLCQVNKTQQKIISISYNNICFYIALTF